MTPILEEVKAETHTGYVVYLIHLLEPLKHARHYVGSTSDLANRIRTYRKGTSDSAAFMRAVHRAGIGWTLARVWHFNSEAEARDFEYRFKKGSKGHQRMKPCSECSFCREEYRKRARDRMRARRSAS